MTTADSWLFLEVWIALEERHVPALRLAAHTQRRKAARQGGGNGGVEFGNSEGLSGLHG